MNNGNAPFLDLTAHEATDPAISGGAASSLALLARAGLRVPPGFVVTAAAYRCHLEACLGLPRILATVVDAGPNAAALALARREIAERPLPAEVSAALRPRLAALLREGPVILRPSPTWPRPAGRPEPELGASRSELTSIDGALAALPEVFAALWQLVDPSPSPPGAGDVAMAVIVQSQLRPGLHGVVSPVDAGDDDKPLALRLRGPGTDRSATQFIALASGDVLAGEARGRPRLPGAQARLLAAAYRQARHRLGFPQDLTWAVSGGELFILGSRPVSRLPERWLRAPMAERFPQALSPLTWDLLADGYERAFDHATHALGLPPMALRWLSCVDGWVRINQAAVDLCLVPLEPRWRSLAALERTLPDWSDRFGWLQELPTAWLADLDRYLLRLGRLTTPVLDTADVGELWRKVGALRELGLDFFRHHGRVELAGLALRRHLLRLLRAVAGPALAPAMMADLLLAPESRLAGLVKELRALRQLGQHPEAREWLGAADARAAWLAGPPAAADPLGRRLASLIADHGHLAGRYDLTEPTWEEEPWRLLGLLSDDEAFLTLLPVRPQASPSDPEEDLGVRRGQAEARLMALVPTGLRAFTADLLRLTRLYQDLPELERYQVRRLAPPLRRSLLALGEHMRRAGALTEATAVFQLNLDELEAWVRSALPSAPKRSAGEQRPLSATAPHPRAAGS